MAESQRKGGEKAQVLDDDSQKAKDRLNMIIILVGFILAVIAMIFVAGFLSGEFP